MTNTPSPEEDRELIERWLKAAAYCEGHKGLLLEDDQYDGLAADLRLAADRVESLLSDRAKLARRVRMLANHGNCSCAECKELDALNRSGDVVEYIPSQVGGECAGPA